MSRTSSISILTVLVAYTGERANCESSLGLLQSRGASLYYVSNGDRPKQGKNCATGSGFSIANGILAVWNYNDLYYDDAAMLAKRAICGAASQVRRSIGMGEGGGFISGYFIRACGSGTVFHNMDIGNTKHEIKLYKRAAFAKILRSRRVELKAKTVQE
ncbi:OLC1v1025665C1 [Oldenlandia corymbosa var. corymbosa]|uniref:OLC1v1025665C1 n=1 Tax=Oldenlandia corymbosa var. corymbosa TaxID=529605 RepID=A0AAV1C5A7_OLDCO|nr:OLC1v1025665C1 [Oldenlandia corymbosa var. corymbosa]